MGLSCFDFAVRTILYNRIITSYIDSTSTVELQAHSLRNLKKAHVSILVLHCASACGVCVSMDPMCSTCAGVLLPYQALPLRQGLVQWQCTSVLVHRTPGVKGGTDVYECIFPGIPGNIVLYSPVIMAADWLNPWFPTVLWDNVAYNYKELFC